MSKSIEAPHHPRRLARVVAASLAMAALSLAPRPAEAEEWSVSSFTASAAEALMKVALEQEAGNVFPQESVDLSNASLAEIDSMIDTAFAHQTYSSAKTNYKAAVEDWYQYYRGTTAAALADDHTFLAPGGSFSNYVNYSLVDLVNCGYSCAPLYNSLGSIYVASQLELYNVMRAQNTAAGTTLYDTSTLNTQLDNVENAASAVLEQMLSFKSDFDGEFGSTWISRTSWEGASDTSHCALRFSSNEKRAVNTCFTYTSAATGHSQTLCPQSDLSWSSSVYGEGKLEEYKCVNETNVDYTTGASYAAQANVAKLFRMQIIMAQRDAELGELFFETTAMLQKIVDKDFAYCGDGVCQIGETRYLDGTTTPWCGDCTASNFTKLTSLSATAPWSNNDSSDTTLLSISGGAKLVFKRYGDVQLQSSTGQILWRTNTGSNSAATFTLQSDGNLVAYSSSNAAVWVSGTSYIGQTSFPPTANTLVLVGDVLYLVDSYGNTWWESDTDSHAYVDLESTTSSPRTCWTLGSQQVLMANRYNNLVWETDGNLNVYKISDGSTIWSTNTSGSNPYMLCNLDNGNLVVYDTSWSRIWYSGTGDGTTSCSAATSGVTGCSYDGYGANLSLDGDQLRLLAATGEPIWASPTCSDHNTYACNLDGNVTTTAVAATSTCFSTGATLLSNDDAELDFTASGTLVLYDKTPILSGGSKTQIWSVSTSGSKVCYTTTGDLAIYNSSNTQLWHDGGSSSSAMMLAGCNFFLSSSTNSASAYSSQTSCTYGSTSTKWGGYSN